MESGSVSSKHRTTKQEVLSQGYERPKALRDLESAFPGLQNDPSIYSVFTSEQTGTVRLDLISDPSREPLPFHLRGFRNYYVEIRETPESIRKASTSINREFYVVVSITELANDLNHNAGT